MNDLTKLSIERIKETAEGGLIYLASPYTHDIKAMQQARFDMACKAAAWLMRNGLTIISPIAHSHPIARYGLPDDLEFWMRQDLPILNACKGMIVLTLPGGGQSKGVIAELQIAVEDHKPIWFMSARQNCWTDTNIDWIINP